MKNKLVRSLTALCAALMLMGSFSVTAFAQTLDSNATNDTGVIVEETEDTPPLTLDRNATLVDDYGSLPLPRKTATISISSSTGTMMAKIPSISSIK